MNQYQTPQGKSPT